MAMASTIPALRAQTVPLAWDEAAYFKYTIDRVDFNPGTRTVKVIFSIADPRTPGVLWDIKNADPVLNPFKNAGSTLRVNLGWNTAEHVNTGSRPVSTPIARTWLAPGAAPNAVGAAYPIQINALTSAAQPCTALDCPGLPDIFLRFWVTAVLPSQAVGSATAAIEGHPTWPVTVAGAPALANVPVKSVFGIFAISDPSPVPRRRVVDFGKCSRCHDGAVHGDHVVPRLSLHGANRNEEPGVCVMCHNPNQTDIPWRTVGREESVDFKRMVHGIHAGGFRQQPLVIYGFRGTITDFSYVRFPAELRDCTRCHVDNGRKGSFELPLASSVLGSTVDTRSALGPAAPPYGYVDVDPSNNLRITPIASVCSSCHDKSEVRRHMISKGASFSALQSEIGTRYVERCVSCHGPGRDKDVRKAHEIDGDDD
jgi:OmcA/MtrC family decaheme c-type cytochrome